MFRVSQLSRSLGCLAAILISAETARAVQITVSWSWSESSLGSPGAIPDLSGTLLTIDSAEIGQPVMLPTSGLHVSEAGYGDLIEVPSPAASFVFTDANLGALAGDFIGGPLQFSREAFSVWLYDLGPAYGPESVDGVGFTPAPGFGIVVSPGVEFSFAVPEPETGWLVVAGMALIAAGGLRHSASSSWW